MGFVRKAVRISVYTLAALTLLVVCTNIWVVMSTRSRIFSDVDDLPVNSVALVLGTSNKLRGGSVNPFFENRIQTAALLYSKGKVSHFLLSGDNRTVYYNEPQDMLNALVKLGVPDSVITLDYAGLRTLDSIIRSKEIFGQDKLIIITQPFHSYRALFISQFYDIDAVALQTPELAYETGLKTYVREYFARTKAIIDLYILRKAPRHLGERENLRGSR